MTLNAVIFGFEQEFTAPAIERLQAQGRIDIKAWFGDGQYQVTTHEIYDEPKAVRGDELDLTLDVPSEYFEIIYKDVLVFLDLMQRNYWLNEMNFHDLMDLFHLNLKYIFNILKQKNIQMVIFSNIPHFGGEYLAYRLAKLMGIETLIATQSLVEDRFFCVKDIDDYGYFDSFKINNPVKNLAIDTIIPRKLFYMQGTELTLIKKISNFLKKPVRKLKNLIGIKELLTFQNKKLIDRLFFYEKYNQFIEDNSKNETKVNLNVDYIYFALHLQPEMTTSIFGGVYCDQILALERLSKSIPKGWKILAKENPKQSYYMRESGFYKRLRQLKNVEYINNIDTFELIRNSKIVSTVSGTVGWEAISYGKPVIIFGTTWYKKFDGVHEYSANLDYELISNQTVDLVKLKTQMEELMSNTWNGVVDEAYRVMIDNFSNEDNNSKVFEMFSQILPLNLRK
ncbi:hypothetical protein G6731_08540 [Polynucleobacter paneuropaeus]|uniref:Capsule polysaccharide biosynthesis protein n=1 Tax=Polynucleobacter paneuropaeus TaxID=2527775 RepID=A0A9Q2WJD9_9BURK|nr:hypothetical protein [Polynucleobacter paneuropaeus]